MSVRETVGAVITTGLLTMGAVGLGYYAGTHDTRPVPTTGYTDERTQDPTGIPYCDETDPIYPCIDLTAMSFLDMWGDSALIIADRIDTGEWSGYGAFDCDETAQDCRWIAPGDITGLYDNDPNIYPTGN